MHPYARRLLDSASGAVVANSPLLAVAGDSFHILASNQTANSDAPPYDPNSDAYMTSHFTPSMAIIVVVLLSAFLFMAFFSIYVRRCTTDDEFNPAIGRRQRSGLDSAMVEGLPMVSYSADTVKEDNDSSGCVVCLTDFEDGEALRLLPKCQHCFHPACIDLWLNSHTTCPMCRRSLLPEKEGSQRGGSNRGMPTTNEENATGDLPVGTETYGGVGNGSDSSRLPEVAVNVRDTGTEQGETTQEMNQRENNLSIAATGEPELTSEALWRLHESPIHGLMTSSPSPFQGRAVASPQRRLTRANSTGHSLVRRAFNRANCLLPTESDDLGRPLYSCLPIAASAMGGLHRSRSQTALPLSLIHRDGEMEGESDLSAMRRDGVSRGWNFSFKRGFSLQRSPEEVLATIVSESSSPSVRRTFERLPV